MDRSKVTLLISVTFFGLLFCMEIYEFVQIYQTLGSHTKHNEQKYV